MKQIALENKIFYDIRSDLASKTIDLGKSIAEKALVKLFYYLHHPSRGLGAQIRKIIVSGIYVGSCKPGPEEHRIPVVGHNCTIDFGYSDKKESAAKLLLAESFRIASERFIPRYERPVANTSAFMLTIVQQDWKDYNIPITVGPWWANTFVKDFWISSFEEIVGEGFYVELIKTAQLS